MTSSQNLVEAPNQFLQNTSSGTVRAITKTSEKGIIHSPPMKIRCRASPDSSTNSLSSLGTACHRNNGLAQHLRTPPEFVLAPAVLSDRLRIPFLLASDHSSASHHLKLTSWAIAHPLIRTLGVSSSSRERLIRRDADHWRVAERVCHRRATRCHSTTSVGHVIGHRHGCNAPGPARLRSVVASGAIRSSSWLCRRLRSGLESASGHVGWSTFRYPNHVSAGADAAVSVFGGEDIEHMVPLVLQ
nr:hypothetical protein CFP56_71033 [Quercus suber]